MIEIRELTKVYRSSIGKPCTAIDKLTLDLPNKGMVFITGKSGSGKSTLLNMIGALDNISRGDIYVESRSVKKFTETEAQEYRSSYLGFIFQDFLLLEELTVRENIELALNISGIKDENAFENIIKRVELEGKEDKFPNELSGGQRQRVAIARALIKNPKMLLCDEPTGNLDQQTSKQIFNILKEESKTKLVVVVSHNLIEAEIYADRIIELFEGKILYDETKKADYKNEFTETENYVILPHHKDLTKKELTILNNKAKNQKFRIVQNKGGFFPTQEIPKERDELILSSSHITRKNSVKLSSMFFRKNKRGAPYIILMTTLLISLFYIFQMFLSFDGNASLKENKNGEYPSFIKITQETEKGTLSESLLLPILDSEVQDYYDYGYEGKIYKLYNHCFEVEQTYIERGSYSRFAVIVNYNNLKESFGTLCCDEEFLTNIYGENNQANSSESKKLNYFGDITQAGKKLIITDYIADSLINEKPTLIDYNGVLNAYSKEICAILNTGYKERYSKVLDDGKKAIEEGKSSSEYLEEYKDDEEHIKFLTEVNHYLGISYLFSDNIYEDINFVSDNKINVYNIYFKKGNKISDKVNLQFSFDKDLEENQMIMNYIDYNKIFGTGYSLDDLSKFKSHKIKIFRLDNEETGDGYYEEFELIGLSTQTKISVEKKLAISKLKCLPYGLYFDNNDYYDTIYEVSDKNQLSVNEIDTGVIPVINTVLSIFRLFCLLIIMLLFLASFLHIVFYGVNSMRRNIYEIGVLKALGAKVSDIYFIFVSQIAIIGAALSVTSILGIYLSSLISDSLLVSAFEDFMTITIFNLDIIRFDLGTMGLDILIVFVLSIISSIIPLIYLKSIKPLNILKGAKK